MKFNFKSFLVFLITVNLSTLIFISCTKEAPSKSPAGTKEASDSTTQLGAQPTSQEHANLVKADAALTGSHRCVSCHAKEVEDWKGSHHEMAMKKANKESVIADFNNTEFEHKGYKSKFYMKDGGYFVSTKNEKGEMQEFQVTHTFGIHPLQQYIVEYPGGKKQCLHIAWDAIKKTWYHLYGDMDIAHGEWLNWTGGSQRWNSMCADCHSTELKKNYDPKTDEYHTTFKEINVSCEACHGPADQHILAKLNPAANLENGAEFIGLKMDKTPSNKTEVEKCARCHSRRGQISNHYDHKGEFMDHYLPEILRGGTYHGDGQILDEVYVYGSFIQSKMFHQHNVRCTDCHNPHTTKLKLQGNALCMQCHSLPGSNGVKDSKQVSNFYNTAEHHFHKQETEAAQCVNCHMTGKHYMGIDFRRDHSFRIPRPDQSVKHGTPNACSNCHEEKGNQWAADAIIKNYGKERRPHFSDMLLPGRDAKNPQPLELLKLAKDINQQAIARATAIWLLQRFPARETYELAKDLMKDKEPLVRYHAMGMFSNLKKDQRISVYVPMLKDKIRAIRIQAANSLADVKETDLEESQRESFKSAYEENKKYLETISDTRAGQMNLGIFHSRRNESKQAQEALRKAIKIDGHFNAARINLAMMLSMEQKYEEAEAVYKKVIELEPAFPGAWYNLGLLYNEMKKHEAAQEAFNQAIIRQPGNLRLYYNRALTLQKLKRYPEAEKLFYTALQRPESKDDHFNTKELAFALIMLQLEMKNMQKAQESIGIFVQSFGQKGPHMQAIKQKMQQLHRETQKK